MQLILQRTISDALVIRVRSLDRRAYLPFTFLPSISSITSATRIIKNSQYRTHIRLTNIESVLLFLFFFFSSSKRIQRNCEKLTKCELWIQKSRERSQTRRYFLFCRASVFSSSLSFRVSIFFRRFRECCVQTTRAFICRRNIYSLISSVGTRKLSEHARFYYILTREKSKRKKNRVVGCILTESMLPEYCISYIDYLNSNLHRKFSRLDHQFEHLIIHFFF